MSWLKRILGGADAQALEARAEALLAEGRPGEAKLVFERARDAARREGTQRGNAPGPEAGAQDRADHFEARIAICRDAVAQGRLDDASRCLDGGELELAREFLHDAAEAAASDALLRAVDALRERMEREAGRRREVDAAEVELSDDERLALLAASWTEDQADEYAGYGAAFETALLALHDEEPAHALETFEALLAEASDPVWLHLEVARARFADDDRAGGSASLRAFLGAVGSDREDTADARLAAHLELAAQAHEADGFDAAVAEYERALEALPEDVRAYFALGQYLRREDHPEEAVDVLEAATAFLDPARPDWRLLEELGLAHREAGQATKAIDVLESVLRIFTERRSRNVPPTTLAALAGLYEEEGRIERAADLWRTAAQGSGDRATLVTAHLEAARLVAELGLEDEAETLRRRAAGLAEDAPRRPR